MFSFDEISSKKVALSSFFVCVFFFLVTRYCGLERAEAWTLEKGGGTGGVSGEGWAVRSRFTQR